MSIDIKQITYDLEHEGYKNKFKPYHTRRYVEEKVKAAAPLLFQYLMKAIYYLRLFRTSGDAEDKNTSDIWFRCFNKEASLLTYYTVGAFYKKLPQKRYYQLLISPFGDSPLDCYRELVSWKYKQGYRDKEVTITEDTIRSVFKTVQKVFYILSIAFTHRTVMTEHDIDNLVAQTTGKYEFLDD